MPPPSRIAWATAATRHLLTPWLLGPQGSCTYIDVLVGSIWIVVARPPEGDRYQFFSTVLDSSFDPSDSNTHLWDMEAIVLGTGCRMYVLFVFILPVLTQCFRILGPNQPYRVLAIENTIYCGGGFYAMHLMELSCLGMLQSFIFGHLFYEDDHTAAYRLLLRRMITFMHEMYVNLDDRESICVNTLLCTLVVYSDLVYLKGKDTQSDLDVLHLPGISGEDNLPNLISLCAIAELLDVLHFDSYRPMRMAPEDKMMADHTRRLARTTLQWLLCRYELQDEDNRWRNRDVVRGTCVYWAKGLLTAKSFGDKFGITNPRVADLTLFTLRRELDFSLGGDWDRDISLPPSTTLMLVRTLRVTRLAKVSSLSRTCLVILFLFHAV